MPYKNVNISYSLWYKTIIKYGVAMEIPNRFEGVPPPLISNKYDAYLQVLGAADLDLRNYPIKFILLNRLKKEGLPVPDGVLVNLKPFYESLLEIFQQNRLAICRYLKIVANEMKFAENGKIEKDIIFHELLNIGGVQLSSLTNDIESIFHIVQRHLIQQDLILRGGDDDVDDQAGKTTSIIIRDFLLASFDVLAGYTNHADILERSQHEDVILPFSNTLTDHYFYTHNLTKIETNLMVSLVQNIAQTKHAGTISMDDKYVHIEFSVKRFYHENSLTPTYTLFFNKATSVIEGLDPMAQQYAENATVKKNCYELIQLAEKIKKTVRKINPLFNKMLLEICMNLDADLLMPAIVQIKTIYSPYNEIVNPKSGIFQIKIDPRQYLNKSTKFSFMGVVIALERAQDIPLLSPDSIAVLKIEEWKNAGKFPYFPPSHRPKVILTNGGSIGMHLITQLKMYGENVARIDKNDFQPLFELALLNKAATRGNKEKSGRLIKVVVERDHSEGKFGQMNWKIYRQDSFSDRLVSTETVERVRTKPKFGNFRDWEIQKTLNLQEALDHPKGYINPDSELVSFAVSIDDEEEDGLRLFQGAYVEFTVRAVHKKSIEAVIPNSYECNHLWDFLSEISENLGSDWINIDCQKFEPQINLWIDKNHPNLKIPLLRILKTPKITKLRILEVEKNTYGNFTGKVLDVNKYRYLTTKNIIDLVFRSGVTYNLTITADSINACNHLSTHFILRAVFKGNKTAIRGSTAEGRVGYADSWNGLYEFYPRDEYLAEIPDILNSLYTLKSIGLDPCFEIEYIQRWIENGTYKMANAILNDERFDEKVVLPIIGYVILPVIDAQGIINTLLPFTIYKHCLEMLEYKKEIPNSKQLWETIKRYFNYKSLNTGIRHHIFQAKEKWTADILFPADIPVHLQYLLIVTPGSENPPSEDTDILNALKIFGKITHTTPFMHDAVIRQKSATERNIFKNIHDISEIAYRKLKLIQSADEPEKVAADTYFNRHVLGLGETIRVSRLLLDRIYQIENDLMESTDFDTCLKKMAMNYIDRLGFKRFEFFDVTADTRSFQAVSRFVMDIDATGDRYRINDHDLKSSYYLQKRPIVRNGIIDLTLKKGAQIYINPEVDRYPVEVDFETPFITIRILDGFGQYTGIIKADFLPFTMNTIPNYKYILNILKPYVYASEQLVGTLTYASIDPSAIPDNLGQESVLSFKKNEARRKQIDKFVELFLHPKGSFGDALNKVALGLMQYPFNFKQIKLFSYDPETRIVLSDRVWADKNNIPNVNTASSFWNKGMGRHMKTGEIFWEAMVHKKPVIALNPANDPRCDTLKYRFLPAGPCIIAPLGDRELIGFIKFEGYPTAKGDTTLAKTDIVVDHLETISRMEQSLYEKAKSIQKLTKLNFPIFSKITRTRLINTSFIPFRQKIESLSSASKTMDINTKIRFLLDEFKKEEKIDRRILIIRTLSQIASSVVNNSDIIRFFLDTLSSDETDTVIVNCLESLLVYCHVSDVAITDKKAVFTGLTRFYLDRFDTYSHSKDLNFQIKNSVLRTLSLLHPVPEVAWGDWIHFFSILAQRRDDPKIIARVIYCIITFVEEYDTEDATLPAVEQISIIAAQNEANQKNKYEAWGHIGPRPEIPLEMTQQWADELLDHLSDISEYHDESILLSESIITALGNLYATDKIDLQQKQLVHFKLLSGLRRRDIRYKHFILSTIGEICKNSKLDMQTRHALMDQVVWMLLDTSEMIRTRAASILVYLAGEHLNYLIFKLRDIAFGSDIKPLIERVWYVLSRYRNNRKAVTPQPFRSVWLRDAFEKPPEQVGYKGVALGELIWKTVPAKSFSDISESDNKLLNAIRKIIENSETVTEAQPTLEDVLQKINTSYFIPEGKIIGTEVFHTFINQSGLIDIIPDGLPEGQHDDPIALRKQMEETYRTLKAYFQKAQMPEEIVSMLERNRTKLIYRGNSQGLDFKGISLRSASDEEDSARCAAAGRFSSFHNLKSIDKIVEHLKYVWASAWSPEARLHRHFIAGAPKKATEINMAVIMQLTVPDVDISGVIFVKRCTAGEGLDTEINAGFGLEAGTRSDDSTDYYALKEGDFTLFKDVARQKWAITPAEEGETVKIDLPPEEGCRQKLTDFQILCIAYICRKLARELLKPVIFRKDLEDTLKGSGRFDRFFSRQEMDRLPIHDIDGIKAFAEQQIQDISKRKRFNALVDRAVQESRRKVGIDFEFAVTTSPAIVLLQQREITVNQPLHMPLPPRFNFENRYRISLPIEPFVYGWCLGETIILREQDNDRRTAILKCAGGKILIANHLDERNLDQFISDHPPLGVIIEEGSKNAHVVIEAREYFQKKKIAIPVVKISRALSLFSDCKTLGLIAEEQHTDLFFHDAEQRDLFIRLLKTRSWEPAPDIHVKTDVPFEIQADPEEIDIQHLPRDRHLLMNFLSFEEERFNQMTSDSYQADLTHLFFINRARKLYFEKMVQHLMDTEIFMDYEDARLFYTYLVNICHVDPKGEDADILLSRVKDLLSTYDYNTPLHDIYRITSVIFRANRELEQACLKFQWDPGILHFFTVNSEGRVTAEPRLFIINPQDGEIVDETPDEFKIVHTGLVPLSHGKQEGPYLRGRVMDFAGTNSVLSADTHIELGLFDNSTYTNQHQAVRAFAMAARQLIHMGCNPNITIHILPRHIQYTEQLKKEMPLKNLSEM